MFFKLCKHGTTWRFLWNTFKPGVVRAFVQSVHLSSTVKLYFRIKKKNSLPFWRDTVFQELISPQSFYTCGPSKDKMLRGLSTTFHQLLGGYCFPKFVPFVAVQLDSDQLKHGFQKPLNKLESNNYLKAWSLDYKAIQCVRSGIRNCLLILQSNFWTSKVYL